MYVCMHLWVCAFIHVHCTNTNVPLTCIHTYIHNYIHETFSVKLCHLQSKMAIYVTLPNFENISLVIVYKISALNP